MFVLCSEMLGFARDHLKLFRFFHCGIVSSVLVKLVTIITVIIIIISIVIIIIITFLSNQKQHSGFPRLTTCLSDGHWTPLEGEKLTVSWEACPKTNNQSLVECWVVGEICEQHFDVGWRRIFL